MLAKTKKTLEELDKSFGISGKVKTTSATTTKTTKSDKAKQSKSSARSLEDLDKQFGIGKPKKKAVYGPKLEETTNKPTAFYTETKNAYDTRKNISITSNMTDDDRQTRIKEINVELANLSKARSGLDRAKLYGNVDDMIAENESRQAELTKELKELQRVGTFEASEVMQFAIDDAKAKKSALPKYNPTARISSSQVDEFLENQKARSDIDKEIATLEAQQAAYKKFERDDELNAHTTKILSNPDFVPDNYNYSPLKPKTDEELKAEGYRQDADGKWYKLWGMGFREGYTGEDSDLYTYINDPSKRLSLEVDKEMVTGSNTYKDLGYHTLTADERKAFNYLYHQDRTNGTNTAEEYLQTISPLLQERALAIEEGRYAELAKEAPVGMSVVSLGTNLANGLRFPVKAAATASGSYDDMPMLDKYGNRTQAIRGAVSEDMGTLGKLAYNAGMSIGDMGVAMLAGGGNAKVVQAIMSSSAGSSTISEAKKNGASDGKALVLGLGSAAIEWATEKYSVEAILKKPETIRGYIISNMLTEGTEEGVSNISNLALDAIVSEVFGERNAIEQRMDYLMLYEGKTQEEALKIAFIEKAQSLGEDVLVGGLTGFGMSSVVATPTIIDNAAKKSDYVDTFVNDEKSLDALIKEGKSRGEGTASAKIAEEIEKAKQKGDVTRGQIKSLIKANDRNEKAVQQTAQPDTLEQAAMEVVAERNKKSGTPLSERLEALSHNNEPIAIEDVKKASGFGDSGAKLLTEIASEDGMTFIKARDAMKVAYFSGYAGEDITFTNDLQNRAKLAGVDDRIVANNIAKENAKRATIYKGAFTENEYTKNWSDATKKMVSTIAKHFGMDISAVDKIIASTTIENGAEIEHEANASHADGKMEISSTAEKLIHALVLHESGHRMEQMATDEWNELANYLYKRAEKLGRRAKLGVSRGMVFDAVKAEHDEAGLTKTTSDYINEIAVRELETIFSSAEEFNNFIAEIESNPQAKSGFQKVMDFITELIEEIKRIFTGTKEEKELERIKELYAKAYLATKDAVAERRNTQSKATDTKSTKNLEIKTNKGYNGNIDYSVKAQRGRSIELETMENNRFERLRNFYDNLPSEWYAFTDKYFYIYSNHSYMDYTILVKTRITTTNRQDIIDFTEGLENGVDRGTKALDKWTSSFRRGKGRYSWHSVDTSKTRATGRLDGVDVRPPRSDNGTDIKGNGKYSESDVKNYSLKEKAPTFYSQMGKTIADMKQDKIGANSVVSYLKGRGVKDEEIKWSGVETFLEGKKSVTKAELQEFVAGSMLQIEEKVMSDEEASNYKVDYTDFERNQLNSFEENLQESWGEIDSTWQEMFGEEIDWDIRYNDNATSLVRRELNKRVGDNKDSRYEQIVSSIRDVELWESQRDQIVSVAKERTKEVVVPKWGEYKLDGGENYREMLFKMPGSDYSNSAMGAHWGNTRGVLAHARIQDFDVKGEKMLFIEEIQSDWHNAGQKYGYDAEGKKSKKELQREEEKAYRDFWETHTIQRICQKLREKGYENDGIIVAELWEGDAGAYRFLDSIGVTLDEVELNWLEETAYQNNARREEIANAPEHGYAPDAPFRNNYHEYVLKRLIRMAAEEGYDSIGWTTADIQSKRWSEQYAEGYRIEYDQDIPKFLNKYGKKWGARVEKTVIGGEEGHWEDKARWVEKEGTEIWTMPITDSMKQSVLYEGQPQYSLKDSDYLKAVESGDMETAQKMVDEAAKAAGFSTKVYHGTTGFGFTKTDVRKSDDGISFFATDSLDLAQTYSGVFGETAIRRGTGQSTENQQRYDRLVNNFVDSVNEIAGEKLLNINELPFNKYLSQIKKGKMSLEQLSTKMTSYTNGIIEQIEEDKVISRENDKLIWELSTELETALYGLNGKSGNYGLYANTENFLQIDGKGSKWSSIPFDKIPSKTTANTREIVKWAKDNGYNGIVFKNIYDIGYHGNTQKNPANVYAFLKPQEQLKSADPVTYNAFGKAIPLSTRFNKNNNDIRYSLKDSEGKTLTEAQREYFKDSKIRDKEGNLLVMYHGTTRGGFTVFDGGKDYWYFTNDKKYAYTFEGRKQNGQFYPYTKERMEKGLATPQRYKVYLNVTNPYIADIDTVEDALYWDRSLAGLLREKGYDALMVEDMSQVIVLNKNQIKNTTNTNPTSDPDINFSLKKSVEETKNLIAVHNMQSSELERTLDLGGLPMPSIAIIKAQSGHSEYGDVSLVFDKSVIDPKANKLNKVYGGDAWTPVYPKIEYKPNEKVSKKISDKYYEFSRQFGYDESKPLYSYVYDLEEQLNRNKGEEGLINELYEDTRLMQLYLLDSGKDKVETIQKETRTELTDAEVEMNEFFIKELGADVVDEIKWDGNGTPFAYRKNYISKYEDTIRETYKKLLSEVYRFSDEQVQNVLDSTKAGDYVRFVFDAYKYRQNGRTTVRTEADYEATQQAIREATGEDYRKWVDSLFKGVEEKSGIRNNTDYFTNSGNRRSWEALHWENNLENVIKVMKSQDNGVAAFFSGQAIWAVSAKDYRSIEEIKADSDRLKKMPEEEYNKIKEGFGERLSEIAHSIMDKSERNPFIASDNAMECIVGAVRNSKTKSGILNRLKQYRQLTVTETTVDDIVALVSDISNMPTEYFEAKPKRAVELNEIATAIIPDSISKDTKARLDSLGIKYLEYEAGNENARLEALNSLEEVQFSLKGTSNINTKDQKELLDIIEHLKGEFEVTKFAKADPKKLSKMTKDILKEYNSKADFDETYKDIDELYQYMANGEDGNTAVWEDVYSRAYNVAQKIVENALVVDDYMYQTYKSLREYLRNTPIKFDARHDSVPSSYENFNEFRKMNMGRLNFTNNGMSIDYIYQELSGLYPEFFNAEEQITSEEQFETIIDVLDQMRPTEVNPFDRQIEQVSMQLANDLTSRFFDIPQAKPTFADKAERRVVEAHIKGGKRVEAVRQQKNERIKALLEAQREKTKKQLNKIREQRDTKVKKEQAKRRDAISKMSESQKVKVLRARITRHASDLSKKLVNPTDNQHIPSELQGAVATLLECINLESNYTYDVVSGSYKKNDEGLPSKRTKAFNELRDVYKNIASSVVVDPDLVVEGGLLSDVISLADKRIVDMNSSELNTVWQTIRAIEASISTANKMFSQGKYATILEYAEKLRQDNADKAERTELKGVIGKSKKLAMLDMLTPETYFHYLGSAGDSIFRMMRDAQDKHISIMKEVADFTHKALKGVDVNSLEKTVHTVKLGGEEVQLTTAQLMELYVLMKREQAVDHIMIGGILPDTTEGKGLKLNTKAEPIRNLTIADITRALSKLTDEQKKIADKLQNFVSTVLSGYGNEASMKVYNYEKFLEKNYWTIRTNKQEIQSEIGKDTSVTSVANKGMAKGTVPHANTSVRIGSIFDTFASHSSDMATYAAWLGTSEDVNRIRNFVFWENGTRKGTVKGILDTVHGVHGSDYLQKLLTDVAIGVKGTDNMNPFDKLIGHYKAASVGANIRVVIQQPTAILRATDMIGAHYLAEGAIRPLKGWEKAKKYAPIAQWKDWGHFDINTGRQMKDVLFNNASLLEKTKQVGMWGASMADSLAWGQLWNAVEAETKAKHKDLEVGSDAYYETVAKRFTEIVDHTQVVDGILQRSQIMRSPDALSKMATSFMGEPTKQYNMAIAAAYDAKNQKGDAKKKAVARLGRTAASLVVAGIVNACAQSIIDAMRDDDKEKDYWEKWLAAFVGDGEETKFINSNLANTFNPLSYVPFAKDILSIVQGYDVKRMDMETITKTSNAVANMYKAITGTGKYTIAEASIQLVAEISRMFGLPVANVKRDIKSLVMSVAIETDSYLMQYRMEKAMLDINYAGNSKNFMDILFNAYNNDREAYEYIYKDMLQSGYDAEKIQNGMETRMKKAEGVEKASDLTKRYMTPEDEKKYDSSLKRVKTSGAWKSATSTQRKNAEADLYDFLTSTSEAMEKTRAEARAFGVDETEYTLWQLAKEMVNDSKDSMNAIEKAAAIEMLDLGNSELAYFYNTDTADKAYAGGVDIESLAMFKAAVSGLKGDNKKSLVDKYARKYASTTKEYLFFMGSEYSSYKKRSDYIRYFGK